MLIINRYFIREFLKIFMLCMATFIALYIMVDLFDRMDDILKRQVPLSLIIMYCLCGIPMIVFQVCPLGVLLSTFITIGLFVRHNEITALKAHGISLFRVLQIFMVISIGLCFFSIWLQEYVLPYTNTQFKEIKNVHIKGRQRSRLLKRPHFWYRSDDAVYNIEFFDPEKNRLQKIAILYFGPGIFLSKRIDAQAAVWVNDMWQLQEGTVREFLPNGEMTLNTFTTKKISINKTPEDFKMSRKEGDEMSISELRGFIKKIRREGFPSAPYVVDMHAKISYSFINVIMALLGIPFALWIGRSGGMALGIAISIATGFLYWTFFAFCLSLGKGGSIPPFMAAWIANGAFGALGVYIFLHVRQ